MHFLVDGLLLTLFSLFHVVVDTDQTASAVLDAMLTSKTGRVTFMPLNRLHPKSPALPDTSDCIPILSKLSFDPKLTKAFQQVFGKTCVCRDLSTAAAYVKSHGINTITLDGDKVDRKGALTGGYHDVRRSRIEGIKAVTSWRAKFEEESQKSKATKSSITELETKITEVGGRKAVLQAQQTQIRDSRDRLMSEGQMLAREKERLEERIAKLGKETEEIDVELRTLQSKVLGLKTELGSPLSQGLTAAEEEQMEELGQEVEKRTKAMSELSRKRNVLESKKSAIEIELTERLRRRREELKNKIDSLDEQDDSQLGDPENDLEGKKRELKALAKSIDTLTKKTTGNTFFLSRGGSYALHSYGNPI